MKLGELKHKFENDGHFQKILHIRLMYFWAVNVPVIVAVFIFAPGIWAHYGLFYTLLASLYANFATDYGAVSAAEANENTDA